MDRKLEVRAFLFSCRDKITPREAGSRFTAETARWTACAVKRSRCRRASASSTAYGSSGATRPAPRTSTRPSVAGDLTLNFEPFELPADGGLTTVVYDAEPDTRAAGALTLRASSSSPAVER